jgi:hypothetical protein
MKNLIFVIVSILSINGCSEKKQEKLLIEKFLNEIKLNKEFKFLDSKRFIKYNDLDIEKEKVISFLINENIKLLRKDLNKQKSYNVLTHKQSLKDKIKFNFIYSDYSKVYYVIGDNNNIITAIIIDSNKIISFSYNIIKNRDKPRTPFLLNNL